jgi:hypothetical protein
MGELISESMFEAMRPFLLEKGKALVEHINAIFHFEIRKAKGTEPVFFTLDLKNGEGSITKGKIGESDASF